MSQWYNENIEPEIRPLVILLRENGFNTTNSCGHKMWIEMDLLDSYEIRRLYDLLFNNNYTKFLIEYYRETYPINRQWLMLTIGE